MADVEVLLVAAGASTRMGQTKQLLPWTGDILIKHQIKTLLDTERAVSVVLGANADKILKHLDKLPINIYRNMAWQEGMGNSIAFGMKKLLEANKNLEGVLITLVDQPLLTTIFFNHMIECFQPGEKHLIASKSEKGWLGAPVLFDKTYFEELLDLRGDQGAKNLIRKNMNSVRIINGEGLLEDIDTPEAYHNLLNKLKKPD